LSPAGILIFKKYMFFIDQKQLKPTPDGFSIC